MSFKYSIICFLLLVFVAKANALSSRSFQFTYEGNTLVGLIDSPTNSPVKGLVILIPGYGKSYVYTGRWNLTLREQLNAAGYATFAYDKAGCGDSEGTFDANQLVQDSATEVRSAIKHLKEDKVEGSENLGLWGISRAGWIAPLVIEKGNDIAFWISVSGPTHLDNTEYLIKSNWRSRGYSEQKIEALIRLWHEGFDIQRQGGTYEQYLQVAQPIVDDPFMKKLRGEYTEEKFLKYQSSLKQNPPILDSETRLMVLVEDFESSLNQIKIPVLGVWGKRDLQVNWQAAYDLYHQQIGESFTGVTLEQCNHLIRRCDTCEFGESQQELLDKGLGYTCEGYQASISDWLRTLH